jgi:hypothetical protein
MADVSTGFSGKKVIILIEDVDRLTLTALGYAKNISDEIIAFSAVTKIEEEAELRLKWNRLDAKVPYIIRCSQVKGSGELLLEYINSPGYSKGHDEVIVVIPLVIMKSLLRKYLNRIYFKSLKLSLSNQDNIVLIKAFYYMDKIS